MAQKNSLFNRGLCRSWLKRCWPLWTTYLAALLLTVPNSVPELKQFRDVMSFTVNANATLVRLGQNMAQISIVVCIIAAMMMYSYMYSSRACGMMNALPVRRETAFATAFITGLAPLIIADVIVIGAAWAVYARTGVIRTENVFIALGFAVMGKVAFYGFATFCAVLTGSLVVLPAVYFVLGCTAAVVEYAVHIVLGALVYGFSANGGYGVLLSPIIAVGDKLSVGYESAFSAQGEYELTGELIIDGMGLMAAYCAAGLILAVCALIIYRRREMERAGDVVAIPVLKPIFKYCMTFGCALVLAISPAFFGSGIAADPGIAMAAVMLALLLAGAFVGYFASEMLMQKTLRVFRGQWRGFAVSCAVIAALALAAELDVTGYERRTPSADDVESATLNYNGEQAELRQPENIAAFIGFHEEVIAQKDVNEGAEDTRWVDMEYTLRGGKKLRRAYSIADDAVSEADPNSNIRRLETVLNTQEAVDYRIDFAHGRAVEPLSIDYAEINGGYVDENGMWRSINVRLTAEQGAEFYNECLVPDSKDSHIGHVWTVQDEEYFDTASCLSFDIRLRMERGRRYDYDTDYAYIVLTMDASRCAAWLEENEGLALMSQHDADPAAVEEQLSRQSVISTADTVVIGGADGPTAIFLG